jgi:hypothetical protein
LEHLPVIEVVIEPENLDLEKYKRILDSFEKRMEKTYPAVLPKSRMGQSIAYNYALWPRMKNYLKEVFASLFYYTSSQQNGYKKRKT